MQFQFEPSLATGNIGGQYYFLNHPLTFVATADIELIVPIPDGYAVQNLSLSVIVQNVGVFSILTDTCVFVNNVVRRAGLSRVSEGGPLTGPDLIYGAVSPVFMTWNLTTPLDTIQGPGQYLQWQFPYTPVMTNAGILTINDGNTTTRFTATAVPAPGGMAVTSVLFVAAVLRTRRSEL